jgi:hypothetical protein
MRLLRFGYWIGFALIAACHGADVPKAPANVPMALEVPGNPASPKLHAIGRGVQIYTCSAGQSGTWAWTFKAPQATLFAEKGSEIGKHYAGPTWELDDGSKVVGSVLEKVAAPNAAQDIPWLLLQVTSESGSGELSGVRYVQRLDTAGGDAAAADCNAGSAGQDAQVDYQADYYFW